MVHSAVARAAMILLLGVDNAWAQTLRGSSASTTASSPPSRRAADSTGVAEDVKRQLMEASADQAVIKFTGSGHFETTNWQSSSSGTWEKQRILRRPGWQKTTRCTSATAKVAAVCEECWDESSCWTFGAGSRILTVPSTSGNWTRFVSSIHVRCDSPVMRLRYKVQGLRRGELNLRWDGMKLGGQYGQDSAIESSGGLALPVADREDNYLALYQEDMRSGFHDIEVLHPGGHVLELEFIAFGTGSAGAELSVLELSMPESYAQCEDFKVCLDPLAASSPGSVALRNSNPLQLACIDASSAPPNEDCSRWLGCLSENRKEQLAMLLRAAGVGEAVQSWAAAATDSSSSNTTASSATTTTSTTFVLPAWRDDISCVDPRLEDAESWSCDCFSEMETMCAQVASEHDEGSFSYERCVRAQMCNHANVCESWKADVGCYADPTLAAIRESLQPGAAIATEASRRRLEQTAAGLLARRGVAAAAVGGGDVDSAAVERALDSKMCS